MSFEENVVNRRWSGVLTDVSLDPSLAAKEIDLNPTTNTTNPGGHTIVPREILTPLHLVCERQPPLEVVQALLSAHPTAVRVRDGGGRTPLHRACAMGADPLVVMAVLNAYPEAAGVLDHWKNTPLHCACAQEKPLQSPSQTHDKNGQSSEDITETIGALVEAYPDATVRRNGHGWTPLHLSCLWHVPAKVTQTLLQCAAAANKHNPSICGNVACCSSSQPLCNKHQNGHQKHTLLTSLVRIQDNYNETPLEFLCTKCWRFDWNAVRPATSYVSPATGPSFTTTRAGRASLNTFQKACLLVQVLYHGSLHDDEIIGNANVNNKTYMNDPILHVCAGSGGLCPPRFLQTVQRLHPFQISQPNAQGNLPLHLAASVSHVSHPLHHTTCIQFLLSCYPEAAAVRNIHGKVPLQLALEGPGNDNGSGMCGCTGIKILWDSSPNGLALACAEMEEKMYPVVLSRLGGGCLSQQKKSSIAPNTTTRTKSKVKNGTVGACVARSCREASLSMLFSLLREVPQMMGGARQANTTQFQNVIDFEISCVGHGNNDDWMDEEL